MFAFLDKSKRGERIRQSHRQVVKLKPKTALEISRVAKTNGSKAVPKQKLEEREASRKVRKARPKSHYYSKAPGPAP